MADLLQKGGECRLSRRIVLGQRLLTVEVRNVTTVGMVGATPSMAALAKLASSLADSRY